MTPHENRTVAEFDITKMDSYHCHYVLCTSVVFKLHTEDDKTT